MKAELETRTAAACRELFDLETKVELTRPDEQFGDYATNIALQLAKQLGQQPREVAEQLAAKLRAALAEQVEEVSVAGPGFINFRLRGQALSKAAGTKSGQAFKDQQVLVEFGDPNPFKEMHIGHLYSYIVGDAISNLLESAGAEAKRLSYHGDVGLHVAKAIWGMKQSDIDLSDSASLAIGSYYAKGANAYEEDEKARQEIHEINEHVYKKDDPEINKLYEWGRDASFKYFKDVLSDFGIETDKQYFESETAAIGMELVRKNTGRVFSESDGAIVYAGEKAGLHTRVFITSKGLPTYETKDLGLAELKRRDFQESSRSIIITANEQSEYFKVMLAALSEFDKSLAESITHLSHGFVSLSTGKMSSRTGEVYGAVDLHGDVKELAQKLYPNAGQEILTGAIKYEFLKHRLGGDIAYDIKESVSLEGNSGPYLQYAHARARSILRKADDNDAGREPDNAYEFEPGERTLLRKITEYPEIVDAAVAELMPHHICTYLYELAQTFNSFYEHNRVLGDPRQPIRLGLVRNYAGKLKEGLELLGIAAPEQM